MATIKGEFHAAVHEQLKRDGWLFSPDSFGEDTPEWLAIEAAYKVKTQASAGPVAASVAGELAGQWAELELLESKATPAPWWLVVDGTSEDGPDYLLSPHPHGRDEAGHASDLANFGGEGGDALLIQRLRNALPALLAERRHQQQGVAAGAGEPWGPLAFPAHKPAESWVQYYCLTAEEPHAPQLLLWLEDDEQPGSPLVWMCYNGDGYEATNDTVPHFWPVPKAPAAQ